MPPIEEPTLTCAVCGRDVPPNLTVGWDNGSCVCIDTCLNTPKGVALGVRNSEDIPKQRTKQ
jgi:hypothetical protein